MGVCLGKETARSDLKKSNSAPVPATNNHVVVATSPTQAKTQSQPTESGGAKGVVTHKATAVDVKYEVGKELGRGGFSIVREGTDRNTGEKVAIKFIDKKYVQQDELALLGREIDIMKKVNHINVLRLIEIYETDSQLSLVMELVNGGELFYKIVDKGSYSEAEARNIIRQLVEGVDYLHSKGIAHRDLKPENLLCSENGSDVIIKIADFGLSKVFEKGVDLETHCGTPDYAAPEVLRMEGTYDKSVDLWSMGVITYVVLCGFPPFYGKNQGQLFERILNADYDFPDPEWSNISDEAKDFIKHLLVLDPAHRSTTKQCLEHPWLSMDVGGLGAIASTNRLKDYVAGRKAPK